MRRIFWVAPLALAMACNTHKAELEKALADQQVLSAEKDSLLSEVLETSKFVNAVNEELAKARTAIVAKDATSEGTASQREARAAAVTRVQALVTRLNETEQRLEQSTSRARSLSGRNADLLQQIESYKQTVEEMRASAERQAQELGAVIELQRVQIAGLSQTLDTVRTQNAQLAAEKMALRDTVSTLTLYKNTVYWVAGTEKELMGKGVVTKEGWKFLFFGSKTLQPARTLDPGAFTAVDKTHARAIMLPKGGQTYKVLTRQDLAYVDSSSLHDGKVLDELRINSPDSFWAASKFLILVEK